MTITAAYQGVLNIPMYQTPYSIPNGGNQFTLAGQTGQNCILNNGINAAYNQVPYNGAYSQFPESSQGVQSAQNLILTYSSLNTITIGDGLGYKGSQNYPGIVNLPRQQPISYAGQLVWPNMGVVSGIGGWTLDVQYAFVNAGKSGSYPAMSSRNTYNINLIAGNLLGVSPVYVMSANPLVLNLYTEVGNPVPYVQNVGSVLGLGSVMSGLPGPVIALQADLALTGLCANATLAGFGSTFSKQIWINPAPEATSNYIWNNQNGAITVASLSVNVNVTGPIITTPFDLGTNNLWQTDNATLNGYISSLNYYCQPCPNGWIFTPITNGAGAGTYFVSKDGGRYWLLNIFAAQPNGFINGTPPIGSSDYQSAYWIDNAGVVWYTGRAATSGTTTQPMFSLALDIFYNPVILPAFPPTTFPCWSPCLDRIGGRPGNLTTG
jgi:hypothetical protein